MGIKTHVGYNQEAYDATCRRQIFENFHSLLADGVAADPLPIGRSATRFVEGTYILIGMEPHGD